MLKLSLEAKPESCVVVVDVVITVVVVIVLKVFPNMIIPPTRAWARPWLDTSKLERGNGGSRNLSFYLFPFVSTPFHLYDRQYRYYYFDLIR